MGIKPLALGAKVLPVVSAARSGELNSNTYLAEWKDGAPALWRAVSNEEKAIAAKPGPPEPSGFRSLEMVPDKIGWAILTFRVVADEVGLAGGDTILYDVELRADAGAPMDIRLRLTAPGQKDPVVNLGLPYTGEGVWRTLRLSLTIPPGNLDFMEVAVRLRGAKPGATAWVRRASVMLIPPV